MITLEKIKRHSKNHHFRRNGKICRFGNENIVFSVAGGCEGLHGDFKHYFELAIIDNETGGFITDLFFPECNFVRCPLLALCLLRVK